MILATHASYILDASVVAKWFTQHEEPYRDKSIALRDLHCMGRCRLIIPELGLLEVLNAIRYSPKAVEVDTTDALTILMSLRLRLECLDWDVLRKTSSIAWAYDITLYDAVYIALAERLGFPFITADRALWKRMGGHSIVIALEDLEI